MLVHDVQNSVDVLSTFVLVLVDRMRADDVRMQKGVPEHASSQELQTRASLESPSIHPTQQNANFLADKKLELQLSEMYTRAFAKRPSSIGILPKRILGGQGALLRPDVLVGIETQKLLLSHLGDGLVDVARPRSANQGYQNHLSTGRHDELLHEAPPQAVNIRLKKNQDKWNTRITQKKTNPARSVDLAGQWRVRWRLLPDGLTGLTVGTRNELELTGWVHQLSSWGGDSDCHWHVTTLRLQFVRGSAAFSHLFW